MKALNSIYGSWRGLNLEQKEEKNKFGWWMDVAKACDHKENGKWFDKGIKWKLS